jgi:hypothetical protein
MYDDETTDEQLGTGNEALLKEIRDRYTSYLEAWQAIREERRIDMKYVAGDPWDDTDKKARKDLGRPCLSHDELSQYINQAVNNQRQNKRGIKIDPLGNGANDQTAELNQDTVRTIEYRSNAQAAYTTAFQCQVEGGYGFIRLSRRYAYEGDEISEENWDHQELQVKNIANPDCVLYDPNCKDADWGDAEAVFVLDPIGREEFKRQYPKATVTDFTTEQIQQSAGMVSERQVIVCEYWRAERTERKKFGRTSSSRRIVQYITNGIEILKRTPEPEGAKIIPIIPVIGKEIYVEDGAGAKRRLMSLIRLARDPQMSLAYLESLEMEEAGMTPKAPYMGYVGQFETDADAWENITKQPRAFVQVDPVVDAASGQTLPLPQRIQFTPNFQAYEVAKDSCRRAVQAAMGISPLPTAAQRNNEKSGVALDAINQAQQVGNFHFMDNFDRALMLLGRAMLERFKSVYGQEDREMFLSMADGKSRAVKLNTQQPYEDQGQMVQFTIGQGTHNVTVSTGPSFDSQRDAQDKFLDTMVGSLGKLPIPPPIQQKILSAAIKMKNLGPVGDQLSELLDPQGPQEIPPEAQQAIAQGKQEAQALNAYAKKLEDEINQLKLEKAGRVVDNEAKKQIEQLRIEADLAKAEITTKAQSVEERLAFVEDMIKTLHIQSHEQEMQAAEHAHAAETQASDQAAAAQSQQTDLEAQQEAQEAQPTE